MDQEFITASRYDFLAQAHNRQVFHQHLLTHPGQALSMALGMGLLGANAAWNGMGTLRWDAHPWTGWILGLMTLPFCLYFLYCAMVGWRLAHHSSQKPRP